MARKKKTVAKVIVETKPAKPTFICPRCEKEMTLIKDSGAAGIDFKCEYCGYNLTQM